jgi:hypothetical protein
MTLVFYFVCANKFMLNPNIFCNIFRLGTSMPLIATWILLLISFALPSNPYLLSSDEEYERVYLATYPRSGNHWMRALIEEATGIVTSSVYIDDDPPHSPALFPWGGYCQEEDLIQHLRYPELKEVVVIKTHYPSSDQQPQDNMPYTKTLRIVRHPVDSFYSFYVYFHKKNTSPPTQNIPRHILKFMMEEWLDFQAYWDDRANVITIRYEDLYNHPHAVLKFALGAIGYEVTDADVARAVEKHPPRGGLLKHLIHYQPDELALIKRILSLRMQEFGYDIPEFALENLEQ